MSNINTLRGNNTGNRTATAVAEGFLALPLLSCLYLHHEFSRSIDINQEWFSGDPFPNRRVCGIMFDKTVERGAKRVRTSILFLFCAIDGNLSNVREQVGLPP
jgi:hypothetical protein